MPQPTTQSTPEYTPSDEAVRAGQQILANLRLVVPVGQTRGDRDRNTATDIAQAIVPIELAHALKDVQALAGEMRDLLDHGAVISSDYSNAAVRLRTILNTAGLSTPAE